MPIFAYRCDNCGFQKDVLQKRSDPPISECPSCGRATFEKQLSAPAFQLKGGGWYVTDFRDKGTGPAAKEGAGKEGGGKEGGASEGAARQGGAADSATAPAAAPASGSASASADGKTA